MIKPEIGKYYLANGIMFKVKDIELMEDRNAYKIKSDIFVKLRETNAYIIESKFKGEYTFLISIGSFSLVKVLEEESFNYLVRHYYALVQQRVAEKSLETTTAFALNEHETTVRNVYQLIYGVELDDVNNKELNLIKKSITFDVRTHDL